MARLRNFCSAYASTLCLQIRYPALAREIRAVVGSGMGYGGVKIPFWKNYSLIKILGKYRPSNIIEFGSGTTTSTFNWYVTNLESSRFMAFEENPDWFSLLTENINFCERSDYRLCEVDRCGAKSQFIRGKDVFPADFLYIDAPSLDGASDINIDFEWFFGEDVSPRVIVVDSRFHTVKYIKEFFDSYSIGYRLRLCSQFPDDLLSDNINTVGGSDVRHSIFEVGF